MKTTAHVIAPARPCSYLPGERARMEYQVVLRMEPAEYLDRLRAGWRRFGRTLFRPRCRSCAACRSIRIDPGRFLPDRSMRRVRDRNLGAVELSVGLAAGLPDREVLDLYDRYHRDQSLRLGWPAHEPGAPEEFREAFLDNPIPTQEWRYRVDGRLVGVGYVDDLPGATSAIYFFYDPGERSRSPGTWNILSLLSRAAEEGREHVYLGYYVAGCRSLSYKGRFGPSELLGEDGRWLPFRG
ncbi:arginyltransferase [Tautonia sociabilis]|uniref:Arginyltransferase n=1 Tax=Tautonia sociabilis TaxID=2080755 RepID=A0A432ML80_9BACT|nr:arginyltransferase [Tautonia sociabilis]RUL88162.1 arginyltransferase [Tautonia sociabilis]